MHKTIIKTGFSVFAAIAIAKLLNLKFPFFVALPVIMPVQDTFSSAIKSGMNRAFGTVIGAAVGVIIVLIKPENAILSGIGIIVIMYLCNLFKLSRAEAIAGIVFISIMVNLKGESPFHYSINRVLDTLIGICITIAVNFLVSSIDSKSKIIKNINQFQKEFMNYVMEMVCFYNFTNLENLNNKIKNIEGRLNISSNEFKAKLKKTPKLDTAKNIISTYKNTYEHLKMVSSLENTYSLDKANYDSLVLIYGTNFTVPRQSLSAEISTVFNYHISKIIENIDKTNRDIGSLYK